MSPNLQHVAEIGASGRVYIALGLAVMFVVLCAVAFVIGREDRS